MPFLTRYEDDPSRPSKRAALRDVAVRVLPAGVLLWAIVTGFGLLLVEGPLRGFGREENDVNEWLEDRRTSVWDDITYVVSALGNTQLIIASCAIAVGVLYWRTRQWWFAAVPALAVMAQSLIFFVAATVTGPRAAGRGEARHVAAHDELSQRAHQRRDRALRHPAAARHARLQQVPAHRAHPAVRAHAVPGGRRPGLPRHAPSDRRRGKPGQRVGVRLLAWNYLRRGNPADAPETAQTRA